MGCFHSKIEKEEAVARCKSRRRCMKQLVTARHAFSAAHSFYLLALRSTGSALLQFSSAETHLHHHLPPLSPSPPPTPPPPPPPPPPLSPSLPPLSPFSDNWTTDTASSALPRPPPPPPPPPPAYGWDFWDPFAPSSSRCVPEDEWEAATIATASEAAAVPAAVEVRASKAMAPVTPSVVSGYSKDNESELAMVVSRNSKDLGEIVKELDEYFLKAADAGNHVSLLLEVPVSGFSNQGTAGKGYNHGRSLGHFVWSRSPNWRSNGSNGRLGEEMIGGVVNGTGNRYTSHCSTVERLYAWEKKLYQEVKNAESLKMEHEKKVALLRKQEMKGADYMKIEKNRKEIEKLESRMTVATQAIETTSSEIIRLREAELYPQLLELVKGLMCMWRSMYECHQVQTHIAQQLKFLNGIVPGMEPTSQIHRQSTLQLELEVQQWHMAFCNLVKTQRDYINSLTGWLRLSIFQFGCHPVTRTQHNPPIYSISEEWKLALDRIPDKVASEGIKSFLAVIHAVVLQQAEEKKQKKRSDAAFKELEKKAAALRSLEGKYGPYSVPNNSGSSIHQNPVAEKRAKLETLRGKAKEEKTKYDKCTAVTRAMTLNNLQTGFPNVFQAMTGFSSVCMQAYESVFNQTKSSYQGLEIKGLLT